MPSARGPVTLRHLQATQLLLYIQAIEKAITALAVTEAGELRRTARHDSLSMLLDHFPRASRSVRQTLTPADLDGIRRLQDYAPRWGSEGEPTRRNTEYPWRDPATGRVRLPSDAVTVDDLRRAMSYATRCVDLATSYVRLAQRRRPNS